jgi:hypothetical protein
MMAQKWEIQDNDILLFGLFGGFNLGTGHFRGPLHKRGSAVKIRNIYSNKLKHRNGLLSTELGSGSNSGELPFFGCSLLFAGL